MVDENDVSLVDIHTRRGQHDVVQPMPLHDAAAYFASRGQMAAILPLGQFDESSDLVFVMMENVRHRSGGSSLMDAFNITTNMFVEQSMDQLRRSFSIWILLSVLAIIIVIFLLWILLRPRQFAAPKCQVDFI